MPAHSAYRMGVATALTVGVALLAGCGPFGEDADERAADAAGEYFAELEAFAAELEQATKARVYSLPPKRISKAHKRERAALSRALQTAPELEQVEDSDEGSYAGAQAVADRIAPMVEELRLFADLDIEEAFEVGDRQYLIALGFADEVLARSTDHEFDSPANAISNLGEPSAAIDPAERRYDLAAMKTEIREWRHYRERVVDQLNPKGDELLASTIAYELAEIDRTIDLYQEYERHLRDSRPSQAQFAYYDDLWEDELPFQFVPSFVFSSNVTPYLERLEGGEPVVDSLVAGIGALAEAQSVDQGSPAVGDPYREAILDGFVSPLAKDADHKNRAYEVSAMGWMLYRIRELEDTPKEVYAQAYETIMLQALAAGDPRNGYTRLLAALRAFQEGQVFSPAEKPRFLAMVPFLTRELAGPIAPILERTRDEFVAALEGIDLEAARIGFVPTKKLSLDKFSDVLDAENKAIASYDRASRKIVQAMEDGAKATDSPKRQRAALKRALDATRPAPERG